jgi:hypothetical protein
MTVKKSLENRIRGWFPQELTMISTRLLVNHENKQPPRIILPEYKVSTTKLFAGLTIFWIIFYGCIFFSAINIVWHPSSAFQILAWIIIGLAIGIISDAILAKNQLSRISKDYQFSNNGKDWILYAVSVALFLGFGGFVSWFFYSSLQMWAVLVYSWGVASQLTRVLLFAAFERKEKMRLMQSWWGTNIFLVPKAPISNVNLLEVAAEQRH